MGNKAFQPAHVGGIQLKNRIIRSATFEGTALNGEASPAMLKLHREFAEGEVGLIVTGYMTFSDSDHPMQGTVFAKDDSAIAGLRQIADNAHRYGTKIVAQISHQGSQLFLHSPERPVYGASAVTDPVNGITPEPFSAEQITGLAKDFAAAAHRAQIAGFDGVQIHGAHGYLISKFLSPIYNKRTDIYGGSAEGMTRIVVDILKETKAVCGKDFPVWVKLNSSDFDGEDGLKEADFLITAKELARNGMDAIEVSGGTLAGEHGACRSIRHQAYHLEAAKQLAAETGVSVILVGGLRNLALIELVLSETKIAAVSLSRALIREPGIVKRWMGGDLKPSSCVACNGCFNAEGTVCYFALSPEQKLKQKEIKGMFSPKD